MSFPMSFHLAALAATGAYWLDDGPDLSCQDSTGQHVVDGCPLSCNSRLGFEPDVRWASVGGNRPAEVDAIVPRLVQRGP